ncbi:MAG: hypothetical protein ABIG37_02775 [Nanoarchaeota archaeon]|nr:hypothetical protein [Nanoarchaeota archaeon]
MECKSDFEEEVRNYAESFGGFYNAHVHGDRAFTYEDKYLSHVGRNVADLSQLTLKEKQSLVWAIHTGTAFEPECIEERMRRVVEYSIRFGTKRLNTTVDVTYNTRFKSLEIAEKLREEYKDRLELKIGAYNVAGFRDDRHERAEIFEESAKRADFLVGLAEKDAKQRHIGEEEHNDYMLNLSFKLKKPIQFHVGQANVPDEKRTFDLLDSMRQVFDVHYRTKDYPNVDAVHVISPSCYSKEEFKKLVDKMLEYNVGLICCPSAGISMKQDSAQIAPVHNSLAKLWDFALAGVRVSLGTDNINDIFMPSSNCDLLDEVKCLSDVLRFYSPRILAKVACGKELDDFDKGTIKRAFG